jgi:hypothetical protein
LFRRQFKSLCPTLIIAVFTVPRFIEEPAPRRPPYFWWLLANLLALCFAVVSWTVCLHVFGNPEVPRNYEILRKLGRLPKLSRYTMLTVPNGNLLDPKGLYSKFFPLAGENLERINARLMRNYLTNFERPLSLTYIEGDYQVEKVRKLGKADFLSSGFAVRARALVKPDDFTKPAPFPVIIEYVFPTVELDAAHEFRPDDVLSVKKSPNCAAIVHAARVVENDEQMICLTVIPIAYGPYRIGDSITFNIEPPEAVRPAAPFPIFK